ncbi:hypothetical protein PUN28_009619 [Cardiocondyla obscurior]|uniref:Uncharacterized protein n=1 Tax=Cardiocondyla obscurior TaxID=286306 RepID=A0AAW2FT45_9HYME
MCRLAFYFELPLTRNYADLLSRHYLASPDTCLLVFLSKGLFIEFLENLVKTSYDRILRARTAAPQTAPHCKPPPKMQDTLFAKPRRASSASAVEAV